MDTYVRLKHVGRRALDEIDRVARDTRLLPSSPYPARTIPSVERWLGEHALPGASLEEVIPSETAPHGKARTLGPVFPRELAPLETQFVARPGLVLTLPGGILVGPDGAVLTAKGELVEETLWSADLFAAGVPRRRRIRRPRHIRGVAASLVAPWHTNWFHWILNTLPRMQVLERAGLDGLPVVVPEKLSAARQRSLEAIGVDLSRAIHFGRTPFSFDTLVWPSSGTDAYYAPAASVEWLRERILERLGIVPGRRGRRLYISRPRERSLPLPPGYPRRFVENEGEVVDLLRRRGFEVIRPEALSFDEQVAAFAAAELVVAPHGAGSVNALFGHDLALIELFEPRFVDPGPFAVTTAAGNDYWFVLGQTVGPGDIHVPLGLLEATVDAALQALGSRGPASDPALVRGERHGEAGGR